MKYQPYDLLPLGEEPRESVLYKITVKSSNITLSQILKTECTNL